MLRAFIRLISMWYRSDAIRISPATGRLFQLRPGDQFVAMGNLYVVRSASVQTGADMHRSEISYCIHGDEGAGSLVVSVNDATAYDFGRLCFGAQEVTVFSDDVQILPTREAFAGPKRRRDGALF